MVFYTGPGQCMRFTIPMLDPDFSCDNGWVACEELAFESCHGQRFRSTRLVSLLPRCFGSAKGGGLLPWCPGCWFAEVQWAKKGSVHNLHS